MIPCILYAVAAALYAALAREAHRARRGCWHYIGLSAVHFALALAGLGVTH
jgi:hypothetical protein